MSEKSLFDIYWEERLKKVGDVMDPRILDLLKAEAKVMYDFLVGYFNPITSDQSELQEVLRDVLEDR